MDEYISREKALKMLQMQLLDLEGICCLEVSVNDNMLCR